MHSFDVSREFGEDGSLTKSVTAQIIDLRTDDIITLTHGEALYADGIDIVLRSHEDPTVILRPMAEGEEFSTPLGKYQVEAIDLDARTVTVKKMPFNEEAEHRVETLLLEKFSESIETSINTSIAPPTMSERLESLFQ